ncbi:RICIN domain-containing protein [Nonomuraea sp. H19]|uniref:RICIN domain-containing protein n=1 Tax=Nonomuraea sp. H19 TaxID=3452206 RepID=UPI003F88C3EC
MIIRSGRSKIRSAVVALALAVAGAVTVVVAEAAAPLAAGVEDEGADCAVPALPDAGSLPTDSRLPDPFRKLDGTRIAAKSEWRCRRQEIKKLAEKFVYGEKPGKPASVTGTVSSSNITVNVSHNGRSAGFSASVQLPSGTGPFPAVVVLGGFGADTAAIRAAGAAVITYDPYAVGREGTPRNNKQGAYYSIYGSSSSTGLLLAWAWGVSRIIDVIEQSGGSILKADATGVTGCSRFGKGAFVIGAFDQRIALTMPIESGSAGVPIFRGIPGEGAQSLSSAYGEQPWLGDAFGSFTSSPARLPVDTHEIVAMVAPRGLFIMDNPHITNLGPRSASVAALGGAEVYKALGAGENITYWSDIQDGNHCANRPEWRDPLQKNIRKFLLKTSNDPGAIRISPRASGNLAEWRDWQTPTLNDSSPSGSPTGPTPTITPTPATEFRLHNEAAGRCVDSPNSATANGTQLQIYDCHDNANQRFGYSSGRLQILSKCLDSPTNAGSGTRVQLWDCHGNSNQQWTFNSNGTVTSAANNLCLNVTGTGNASAVTIATCNGQATQRWTRS